MAPTVLVPEATCVLPASRILSATIPAKRAFFNSSSLKKTDLRKRADEILQRNNLQLLLIFHFKSHFGLSTVLPALQDVWLAVASGLVSSQNRMTTLSSSFAFTLKCLVSRKV